jgi:hypothetical protein
MSSPLKQIRGQVRQIVQELLPECLKTALVASIRADLQSELRESLGAIQEGVRSHLERIDDRSKDIQHLVMRQVAITPLEAPKSPETPVA